MSKNFFIWGLSVGLIISSISGMEKDFPSVLPKDLDVSDQHYKVIDFLKEKYSLSEDIVHGLHKNNLNGLLAVVLCQWLNTKNTYDKEATGLGLSFEIMVTIFKDVLEHYRNDLMYAPHRIIITPQELHFCDGRYNFFALLKKKWKLYDDKIQLCLEMNLSIENIVLLSQWYNQKRYLGNVSIPFEILLKIFSNNPNDGDKQHFYLTEQSGKELDDFNILFPRKCIVRPRGRSLEFDFSPCNKKITEEKLPKMVAWIMQKLDEHNLVPKNYLPLLKEKYRLESNKISLKFMEDHDKKTLLVPGGVPIFSLLTRCERTLKSVYNDNNKDFCIEEYIFGTDHHTFRVFSKEFGNVSINVPVLKPEETKYTKGYPFYLARYHLVTFYNACIVLYDEKTGKYPCIPLKKSNIKCVYGEPPYVYDNPRITVDEKDYRKHFLEKYRAKKYTKIQEENPKNDVIEVVQPQAVEPQLEQVPVNQSGGYMITKNGYRINCLIQ